MSSAPARLSLLTRLALLPVVATTGAIVATTSTASPAAASTTSTATLSQTPTHTTVVAGTKVRIVSTLKDSRSVLANRAVNVYERGGTSGAWHLIERTDTDRYGHVYLTWTMNGSQQWQTRWAGDTTHPGTVVSPLTTVTVTARQTFGQRVVAAASKKAGDPYQYGAAGPSRFDCSGLTKYVFGEFRVNLAHNAAEQYSETHHVSASSRQVGDLVFFYNSSGIYHVGIYAGNGKMWAAPHTGDHVRLESVFSSSVKYGRISG